MPNTIEQIRDSRIWDLRDQGFDISKVEMRPVGDKWILSVQMERPISIEEELHPKIAELVPAETVTPKAPVEQPADTTTTSNPESVGPVIDWDKDKKDPVKETVE